MRLFKDSEITYWLNYFAESIKDYIESKEGICKIQISFTGNILFIRGYSSIDDVPFDDIIEKDVKSNPNIKKVFGPGLNNSIIYVSDFPSEPKFNICHTYYKNSDKRPIIRPIIFPFSEPVSLIHVSDAPFGYSIDFKVPIYYGEYISKDLLKFTKSEMVHMDYKGEEDLSLLVNSIYPKQSVESCVLDIYDFDFVKFKELLSGFDFKQEILEPYGERPWLKDSKLSEYIIF